MRKQLGYALLGIFMFAILLVAQAPINWVLGFVEDPKLKYTAAHGSIWSGDIESLVYDKHSIGTVNWSFKGFHFFGLAWHWTVAGDHDLTGDLAVGLGGLEHVFVESGQVFLEKIPVSKLFKIKGLVNLQQVKVEFKQQKVCQIVGNADIESLKVTSLVTRVSLGDYIAAFTGDPSCNTELVATATDQKHGLRLEGNIQFIDQTLSYSLKRKRGLMPAVDQFLNLYGAKRNNDWQVLEGGYNW